MSKWQKHVFTCLIAASVLGSQLASADPQNGMGAYAGLIGATENSVGSNGLSLGLDAQFVINDRWSLNPYMLISAERDINSKNVSDGLVGLPVRRWLGEWFVGAHVFEHDRVFIDNGRATDSAYGLGAGVLAGVEYSNGWGAEVQTNSEFIRPGIQRHALRLHLTYRWR